jgi:hypothetical protein
VQLYLVLSVAFFLLARGLGSDSIVVLDKQDVGNAELSEPARAESFCSQFNYGGPFAKQILPKLTAGRQKSVLDGGKALRYAFLKNLPRALFLFLIHNHSAAFMVLAVIMLVSAIPGLVALEGFLVLGVPGCGRLRHRNDGIDQRGHDLMEQVSQASGAIRGHMLRKDCVRNSVGSPSFST